MAQISGRSNCTQCCQRLVIAATFLRKDMYSPGAMTRGRVPPTRYALQRNTVSIMKFFFFRAVEEAKKLCIVTNSYIVKVYGITSWRNHFGIVMEEITGGNLEDLLFNPKISEIKWLLRLRLSVQIMKALEYLHTANRTGDGNSTKPKMQHCDLKPQNILLTDSADVKLCDFSAAVIARATVSTSSCSSACARQYTPNYAAPEILKYQKVCSNSDIYR